MTTSGIVPVIDFAPFLSGTPAEQKATATELLNAMKDVGFLMLKGFHSEQTVTKAQVEDAFEHSKRFFALPQEEKSKLAYTAPGRESRQYSFRGYNAPGKERVHNATSEEEIAKLRAKAPDMKETMEIGREDGDSPFPNRWPENLPEYKEFMVEFFHSCHKLHLQVMAAIAVGFDLETEYFFPMVEEQSHNLRLLNYPAVPNTSVGEGGNRAGAHSDFGSVTLLFQDSVGGLEVQDKNGEFVPAVPVPDTVVVNVGDLLQRWTNDVLKSTVHRVVVPQGGGEMTPQRNSIAFFSNPGLTQMIRCLPELGAPKYPPVKCEEYLYRRVEET
ncbi:oxidoreductase,Oxoglutarate/iron-dependent oxygenase family [Pseudohyphozyma bogoriensis]|nr:oxidoreductase,Oxoglutarate/iron-dependent oxygenase family [Pseudohyphozyma bogoriensis]